MKDVLVVIEGRIPTVDLLEQVFTYIESEHGLTWRTRLDTDVRPDDIRASTIPLIVRTSSPSAHRLAAAFRVSGIGYAFYLDDNFWGFDPRSELGSLYRYRGMRNRLNAMVRDAQVVITSTTALRDLVLPLNPRVIQLDAPIDFGRFPQAPAERDDRDRLRMGFAATAHRGKDLVPLLDVVFDAMETHPEIEFEVIGTALPLPEHPRIATFPYLDSYAAYVAFQRERQWDIGLAPLRGSTSNLYKTDVKYREYAAQFIPGIYQRATPYAGIEDGVTGLIADTPREWRNAIERYVTNPALREGVRRAARADVERRYSVDGVADEWLRQMGAIAFAGHRITPESLSVVRQRLLLPPPLLERALWRLQLLLVHATAMRRDHGLLHTLRRTCRFFLRRIVSR